MRKVTETVVTRLLDNKQQHVYYVRLPAVLIDSIVLAMFVVSCSNLPFIESNSFWLMLCGCLSYHPVFEGFTGQTFGKWLFKIKVVDQYGNPPGAIRATIRTLIRFIIPGFIEALITLYSKRAQRLGDMIAGTYVLTVKQVDEIHSQQSTANDGYILG